MLVKSQIFTQMSGSMGGLTASHNRYGNYVRARSTPVNPNTAFQITVRQAFALLAARWGTLVIIDRGAWDTYGLNVPVLNKVGDSVNLTGFNHYIRSNVPRIQAGLPIVDAAPTTFSLPSLGAITTTVTVPSSSANVSVAFDDAADWASQDDSAIIFNIARPVERTITFFKGPFRFASAILGDAITPITSPQVALGAFAVAVGQLQYTSARLSLADGRLSNVAIQEDVIA